MLCVYIKGARQPLEPIVMTTATVRSHPPTTNHHRLLQEIRAAIARSDTSELSSAMERAYATTFTAAELAFLADYANSEIGRRVQKKMPNYVAKVSPSVWVWGWELVGWGDGGLNGGVPQPL